MRRRTGSAVTTQREHGVDGGFDFNADRDGSGSKERRRRR
jgi:hypothetical protein